MKIIILGHSNSILSDGWASHLQDLYKGANFINLSIGGSPSPALLYQAVAHASEFSSADVVIVEPTVVDHGEDWQTGNGVAAQAAALFSWIKANTAAHILLLILPRTAAWLLCPSQGMQAWYVVGQRHSVHIIDGRIPLLRYCQHSNVSLTAAWRDNMGHSVSMAQLEVARAVVDFISNLGEKSREIEKFSGNAFRVVTAHELADRGLLDLVRHDTSLMSVYCVRMAVNKPLFVRGQLLERVHGIAVNFGALDPTRSVGLVAVAASGIRTEVTVGNIFLGKGPVGRLILMFSPIRVENTIDSFELSTLSCPRFADPSVESFEVAGIFLGPEISDDDSWRSEGKLLSEIFE